MLSSLHQDKRFDHLYEHNLVFRELNEEHSKLQKEAAKMSKAVYLSPDLEMKETEIKKRKLDIKDKLEAMLNNA